MAAPITSEPPRDKPPRPPLASEAPFAAAPPWQGTPPWQAASARRAPAPWQGAAPPTDASARGAPAPGSPTRGVSPTLGRPAPSGPAAALARVGGEASRAALSKRDLLLVVTQLSIMLRSGLDLAEAFRAVANRAAKPALRDALGSVYAALEAGESLSSALFTRRAQFGGVLAASVAAGEASGQLPEVLGRLAALLRDEVRAQGAVRSLLSYPLALVVVTALVLSAMVFFVLPQFADIYRSSRAPTPALTRLLLDGAELARTHWWAFPAALLAAGAFAFHAVRSPAWRRRGSQFCFGAPVLGPVFRSLVSGRAFRLQGTMLANGVPMLDMLRLTRQATGNVCFEELCDQIEASVVNGEGVAQAARNSLCLPDGAADLIATAEANGQLGEVLQTIGEFYESEGEQRLRDLIKLAEPLIIVGLGLVVGATVLAVMLPMLDLSSAGGV